MEGFKTNKIKEPFWWNNLISASYHRFRGVKKINPAFFSRIDDLEFDPLPNWYGLPYVRGRDVKNPF